MQYLDIGDNKLSGSMTGKYTSTQGMWAGAPWSSYFTNAEEDGLPMQYSDAAAAASHGHNPYTATWQRPIAVHAAWPAGLVFLRLTGNSFSGELPAPPSTLQHMSLGGGYNKFTGDITDWDVSQLVHFNAGGLCAGCAAWGELELQSAPWCCWRSGQGEFAAALASLSSIAGGNKLTGNLPKSLTQSEWIQSVKLAENE